MGVNYSKNTKQKFQVIDFGSITPLGLYNKCSDEYDLNLVKELILNRKLSPFYKGLSNPLEQLHTSADNIMTVKKDSNRKKKKRIVIKRRKRVINQEEEYNFYLVNNEHKLHNLLYSNAIECPICFLFYPANINFTRCCDQPICTECFVQIKKAPADSYSTPSSSNISHIVCPYCMTKEFGVVYSSPTFITMMDENEKKTYQIISTTSGLSEIKQSKRKSIESNHPDVVLIDHVRSQQQQQQVINNHDNVSNINNMTRQERANSLQYWFQSRPNATSLERYLASIRLDTLTMQDIIVIETIRQSIIDKEQERLLITNMMY